VWVKVGGEKEQKQRQVARDWGNIIAILAMILLGVDTISRLRCFPDHTV
jgi:flagellar biogenesis protein FliO